MPSRCAGSGSAAGGAPPRPRPTGASPAPAAGGPSRTPLRSPPRGPPPESARALAAYVRVAGPRVERLEQDYLRLPDAGTRQRYRYAAPAFDFECELVYDELGLLLDYPGIGTRVA